MANDQSDMRADTRAITVRAGVKPQALVPQTMEEAYRIANAVSLSGMAPADMNTPEKILISIMHGLEIGMPPLMAVQRIAVINGRPTIWGDAAMGLVSASGLLEDIEETIAGEGDKRVAMCVAKRKNRRTQIVGKFSVEDAKAAGLWGKGGPWKNYPARMLQMRARAFCLRDGFADVLGGLYLREEIEDEPRDVTPPDQQPSQPTKPAGPPRGVQTPQVIEHHTTVTVDVAHGAADIEKPVEVITEAEQERRAREEAGRKIEPTLAQGGLHPYVKAVTENAPKQAPPGPPRGVSKPPAADPRKAYKWAEIEAMFQNRTNLAVQMENLEPLAEIHAQLVDQYEFTPDELDALNKIYDEAERALN